MTHDGTRQTHACLDIESRLAKATKIEEILNNQCQLRGARALEIGTGSGVIAAHMASAIGEQGEMIAVDVVDQRQIREGFQFFKVADSSLPFEQESFDIVISNHVLEHVGSREDQLHHLSEIRRVLKKDGWGYLAVPNRWTLIEPHFKLTMLSWLPRPWRSTYIRWARRGGSYDCEPPTYAGLTGLLDAAGLGYVDRTVEAMRVMKRVESHGMLRSMLLGTPEPILRMLRPIIPTIIFLVRR